MSGLEITYTNPNGQDRTISERDIMQQVAEMGSNVVGISPDGMTLIGLDDDGNQQSLPIQQIMESLGHKVTSIVPTDPDTSRVRPEWRMALNAPGLSGDPDSQKAYLEARLRREGVENPQVYGKGQEWYSFDPASQKWHSLTNTQGLDLSDLAAAVPGVVSGIGSTVGGIMGGTAGGAVSMGAGSIPGMMAGGAAGGAAGAALTGAGIAAMDPDYRDSITAANFAKNVGIEGAIGAAGSGIMGGVAKVAPKIATTGIGSSIVRGAGRVGEIVGDTVGGIGKFFAGGPIRKDILGSVVTPGGGTAQAAGLVAQAPEFVARKAPELVARAAETGIGKRLLGEEGATALANESRGLLQAPTRMGEYGLEQSFVPEGATNLSNTLRGVSEEAPRARNVLSKLGEMIGDKYGWRQIQKAPSDLSEEAARALMQSADQLPQTLSRAGEATGRIVENLASAGRATEQVIRGAGTATSKAAQYGGGALKGASTVARKAGTLGQPFENTYLMNRGLGMAEEAIPSRPRPAKKGKSQPLRSQKGRETIQARN